MSKRYYSSRSSVVIPASDMICDLAAVMENTIDFYDAFYNKMRTDNSYDNFKKALIILWRKHYAKEFFSNNYTVRDVLTKFEGDDYHTCVASSDDVKDDELQVTKG